MGVSRPSAPCRRYTSSERSCRYPAYLSLSATNTSGMVAELADFWATRTPRFPTRSSSSTACPSTSGKLRNAPRMPQQCRPVAIAQPVERRPRGLAAQTRLHRCVGSVRSWGAATVRAATEMGRKPARSMHRESSPGTSRCNSWRVRTRNVDGAAVSLLLSTVRGAVQSCKTVSKTVSVRSSETVQFG